MLLPRIETERLVLRTYRTEDLDTVFRLCSDAHVTRFFHDDYSVDRADVLASLPRRRKRWRTHGFGQLGAFEKQSGALIGFCGLQYLDKTPDVEIYYGFFKQFWGKGIATEAARAVLRFGFERLNLEKIVAATHLENAASQAVLRKLGMTKQAQIRNLYGVDARLFILRRADADFGSDFYKLNYEQIEDENLND